MGSIRVLPPGLVNRIAAGECIERPASVVKELVENALDAGAQRVDISISEGGRELIAVTDDGVGIAPDELRLAVHPHATSKLHDDEDLFNIHTMGFRGEALASIGSVSRLTITSRRTADDVGHALRVEAGVLADPIPCAAPVGTRVEVRDLFYCVPARRKFLRTNQSEMGHITEQLARVALAYSGVAFSLTHQGRKVHQLAATSDRRQRIADFFGRELADVLLPIRRSGDGMVVEGLVAPPAESRGSGKWEYVFVNGRFVRDRFVSHAIKEAYRSLIDPHRYPVAFLFITIDPGSVDVNVHPTKIEVRWRDSNYIHGQVLAALRERFLSTRLDHALDASGEDPAYRERVRTAMVEFFQRAGRPGTPAPRTNAHDPREPVARGAEVDALPLLAPRHDASWPPARELAPVPPDVPRTEFAPGGDPTAPAALPATAQALARAPLPAQRDISALPADGPPAIQLHNTYLVVETPEGLMIIDQHALHERILYEELRSRIQQRPLEAQRLLLPEMIRVPSERIEALELHQELLGQLGIELSAAGPASVGLHAFPSLLLDRVDVAPFVRDLLDLLGERGTRPAPDTLIHQILDLLACKAAVKAGDALTRAEISALLERRDLAERSSHCPHGRPTTLHLTLRDLERQFRRR